jgi:hypothetical protein
MNKAESAKKAATWKKRAVMKKSATAKKLVAAGGKRLKKSRLAAAGERGRG